MNEYNIKLRTLYDDSLASLKWILAPCFPSQMIFPRKM